MLATFHERQYELAMNIELLLGSGAFFAPMQVVEEAVGYDIALVPGEAAIWQHLGIAAGLPGTPTAIAYGPANVPMMGGPVFSASLFCQYKRPERMIGATAGQRAARSLQGGALPYFRVFLDRDQHEVLSDLEQSVGQDAVVRYAAPRFHRIEDLWVRQATRQVAGDSVFISPSEAGNPPSCGPLTMLAIRSFSAPRRGSAERREDVLRTLRERPGSAVPSVINTSACYLSGLQVWTSRPRSVVTGEKSPSTGALSIETFTKAPSSPAGCLEKTGQNGFALLLPKLRRRT